ncbi:Uncharacterised protein [Klebsiella variicola]|nr:Uncharacterised protein [Klebsiella variicola]
MNNKTEFKFGDYAIIEQKRHGVPNEMFVHKVIDQLRSNTWVDVPVQSPATETMHDEMEDVCLCICCGVDETEVRRYRVKDMRHRSLVSAVSDEKKGSTITLQAVNELIATLESAGEPSIREQKFLKLAKEFRICSASLDAAIKTGNVLAEQNSQLAAENVEAKKIISECREYFIAGVMKRIRPTNEGYLHMICDTFADETPATDRIVAGIKADGVALVKSAFEEHIQSPSCYQDEMVGMESALSIACQVESQLREGADK